MMIVQVDADSRNDRIKSATAVVLVHVLLAYAFVAGLRFQAAAKVADTLAVFDLSQPAPPPPPVEEPVADPQPSEAPEGAASPPNLKAQAAPVKAPPPPPIRLEIPPPIATSPTPAQGSEASAGVSDVAGPGTGAGGTGTGTGSGDAGSGSGGGGVVRRSRHVSGRISHSDYPRGAGDAGAEGTVIVQFEVGVDGRVSGCEVADTSGNAELDATTCRLVEARFRYEPARNAEGKAITEVRGWQQDWWIGSRRRRANRLTAD